MLLYANEHNPDYFIVVKPGEAYFINFNPLGKPDETGNWPISNINQVAADDIAPCIESLLSPDEEFELECPPYVEVTGPNAAAKMQELADKIEKFKHKFIK